MATGAEFEHYVCDVLYENGHHATVTKGSGDYGVDIVLNGNVAVQVKMYAAPVGQNAVREVIAGKAMYECAEAWVVTNSTFTRSAVALAKANGVRLIAGDELQWMHDNPDKTADHRERYEAAKAEAKAKAKAKAKAELKAAAEARVRERARQEMAAEAEAKERAERQAALEEFRASLQGGSSAAVGGQATSTPSPDVRQQIVGWKARRDAQARSKQVADWHARTGSWWRERPDSSKPATGE